MPTTYAMLYDMNELRMVRKGVDGATGLFLGLGALYAIAAFATIAVIVGAVVLAILGIAALVRRHRGVRPAPPAPIVMDGPALKYRERMAELGHPVR